MQRQVSVCISKQWPCLISEKNKYSLDGIYTNFVSGIQLKYSLKLIRVERVLMANYVRGISPSLLIISLFTSAVQLYLPNGGERGEKEQGANKNQAIRLLHAYRVTRVEANRTKHSSRVSRR